MMRGDRMMRRAESEPAEDSREKGRMGSHRRDRRDEGIVLQDLRIVALGGPIEVESVEDRGLELKKLRRKRS